jgi:hypothetical protein
LVHARHPGYRPVTKADAPFPDGARESEWRLMRSRHSDDVNAEVREAVERGGYPLFPRLSLSISRIVALANSEIIKTFLRAGSFPRRNRPRHRAFSPR